MVQFVGAIFKAQFSKHNFQCTKRGNWKAQLSGYNCKDQVWKAQFSGYNCKDQFQKTHFKRPISKDQFEKTSSRDQVWSHRILGSKVRGPVCVGGGAGTIWMYPLLNGETLNQMLVGRGEVQEICTGFPLGWGVGLGPISLRPACLPQLPSPLGP